MRYQAHPLNHQVCVFHTVSPEGFTPFCCAKFVLKIFTKDRIE